MDYKELEKVYADIAKGCDKENYKQLFSLQSFLFNLVDYDPVTNLPLPSTLDSRLETIMHTNIATNMWWNDRFQNIINFSSSAIIQLIDLLHEKNIREYHVNHPSKIREVDSKCIMWLSKKPGFTIKQKIASSQRMMGVYHSTSLDTSENRLFKAFLYKIDYILTEKATIARQLGFKIPGEVERLMTIIHSWRYSDECAQISDWNNVPPNNTLLNDKNYHKIWISWGTLQLIDQYNSKDLTRSHELKNAVLFWVICAILNENKNIRFCQRIIKLRDTSALKGVYSPDKGIRYWQDFSIRHKGNRIQITTEKAVKEISFPENLVSVENILDYAKKCIQTHFPAVNITEFHGKQRTVKKKVDVAAIDINGIRPAFANDLGETGLMAQKLLFQSFGTDSCSCASSKYIDTQEGSPLTFSIHHVFSEINYDEKNEFENSVLENDVCRSFAHTIRNEINCNKCIYVVNDDIDDFSKAVVAFKRSMNAAFVQAEILPRSIAYVFELSKKMNFKNNQIIHVSNQLGETVVHTDIKVIFDEELLRRNPATKGFKFIRQIPQKEAYKAGVSLLTEYDKESLENEFTIDGDNLVFQRRVHSRETGKTISAKTNCSTGALEYERLQKITPDIPLWGDVLPTLKMVSDGMEYNLVELNQTIFTIRGKPINIPVKAKFECPADKDFFEFNLIQGDAKSRYFAYIKNHHLPFRTPQICTLKLTYTYGDEFPYQLEFVPQNKTFKPLHVSWETKSHKDRLQLPYPEFISIPTWDEILVQKTKDRKWDKDLQKYIYKETNLSPLKRINLFYDYLENSFVSEISYIHPAKENTNKSLVSLNYSCETIQYRDRYTRELITKPRNITCLIDSSKEPSIGDKVWFILEKTDKGYRGSFPILLKSEEINCCFKGMRSFSNFIWNGGKSIYDDGCPANFKKRTEEIFNNIIPQKVYKNVDCPNIVQQEIQIFLSRLHKDGPLWFKDNIARTSIDEQDPLQIAFLLGDCSQDWQQKKLAEIFHQIEMAQNRKKMIAIFAIALWREKNLVFKIPTSIIRQLLFVMDKSIENFDKDYTLDKFAVKRLFTMMECLLSFCRLRETRNKEILRIMSPFTNNIVKNIVEQLKRISQKKWSCQDGKWFIASGKTNTLSAKSYLTFSISNESTKNVPELLQATLGYLSGSINSNAIKVLDTDFDE